MSQTHSSNPQSVCPEEIWDDNRAMQKLLNEAVEEANKEKAEKKARRNETMEKFIDMLKKKMILEYKEFDALTERHYVRYKWEKGEPLVLFPMIIQEWTIYDDYTPIRYNDPPEDEFIVCDGQNKYGLHFSISNEKIKYLHRAKKPVYFTFTTQKS
jgi:hypothetical protein